MWGSVIRFNLAYSFYLNIICHSVTFTVFYLSLQHNHYLDLNNGCAVLNSEQERGAYCNYSAK